MNTPSTLRRLFLLTSLVFLQTALELKAALVESAQRAAPQPHWAAEGGKANAWFGFSAAAAGDVNGDGFGDIIVGAHGYDAGLPGQGKVFLFYGSKDGLASEAAWSVVGEHEQEWLGISVACAGDVNGDGFDDIIIGASGHGSVQKDAGRVMVYFGSASGLAATASWILDGDCAGAALGSAVAGAGDVNGDNFADILVGAPGYDGNGVSAGRALLFAGSDSGPASTPLWHADGQMPGNGFGFAVASAGDVNGDGLADFMVGAPFTEGAHASEGIAYVYFGAVAGPGAEPSWTARGRAENALFGSAVASAGDFNGDGFSDIAVGAPGYGGEGSVVVFYGSPTGPSPDSGWRVEGGLAGGVFGAALGAAGDVNGDGFCDLLVGAPGWSAPHPEEGAVFLFAGAASPATAPAWGTAGGQAGMRMGQCVASAGDVNGDGFADLLAGAHLFSSPEPGEGAVFVYLGKADAPGTNPAWTVRSGQAGARLGFALVGAGDVNGDGFSDVAVSAYLFDAGKTDEGRVFVFAGSPEGLSKTPSWIMDGNQADGHFGRALACAGDVNGDGYDDLIVGAPGYVRGERDEGAAFIFKGGSNGLASRAFWIGEGNQANASYGFAVSGAGDVNGDGFADILVGAYRFDAAARDDGRVFLYFGGRALSTNASWSFDGGQTNCCLGNSVACAGDVNGDGFSDVIIGAYRRSANLTDQGSAHLFLGSAKGLGKTPDWSVRGAAESAFFGWPVAGAGDVNGDGFSDVMVGAWGEDSNKGKVRLYHGSAAGLATNAAWSASGSGTDDYFGSALACAGDVNGDGFSDVIIGAYGYDAGELSNAGRAQIFTGASAGLSSTPAWSVDGGQAGESFGRSVACAGDVNGDGFADIIVAADCYRGTGDNEGRVALYYGNGGGLVLRPRALSQSGNAVVPLLGFSGNARAFGIGLHARAPFGPVRAALAWQAVPVGHEFGGAATVSGMGQLMPVLRPDGQEVREVARGLRPGTVYRWRCRLCYNSGQPWAPRFERWLTGYGRAWHDGTIRTDIRATPGDYDGDGRADQALYDQAGGGWFIKSVDGRLLAWNLPWGGAGMTPACGDFDGDAAWDMGVYQYATGFWFVRSLDGRLLVAAEQWGGPDMMPVPADYDGDRRTDFGVYSPASGCWFIKTAAGQVAAWNLPLGAPGFVTVPGDYDADNVFEPAVFNPADAAWYGCRADGTVTFWAEPWGAPGMAPALGDYNGDGAWDLAVYDEASGAWYAKTIGSGNILLWAFTWGGPGFVPMPGDYDGDNVWDLAVYDPASGLWFIIGANGQLLLWGDPWGGPGLTPVPAAACR